MVQTGTAASLSSQCSHCCGHPRSGADHEDTAIVRTVLWFVISGQSDVLLEGFCCCLSVHIQSNFKCLCKAHLHTSIHGTNRLMAACACC